MRDNLPKSGPKSVECGIINLDSLSGSGSHWIAYKKCRNNVITFDPFGDLKPPQEVINYFKNCKIYYNIDRYQQYNTPFCGHLCLVFLSLPYNKKQCL